MVRLCRLGFFVFFAAVAQPLVQTAEAATFHVTITSDLIDLSPGDGQCDVWPGPYTMCSLRGAIMEANHLPGNDVIELPAGHYVLTRTTGAQDEEYGDLDIDYNLVIHGEGASTTVIDANQIDRVLHVHATDALYLYDLTIRGGEVGQENGGGILNEGSTYLERCRINNNVISSSGDGGGIYSVDDSWAHLEITDSTLQGNAANNGRGNEIACWSGSCDLIRSTLIGDSTVGWVDVVLGNATIENCTLRNALLRPTSPYTYSPTSIYLYNSTLDYPGGVALDIHSASTVVLANTIVHGDCRAMSTGAIVESRGGNLESPGHTCGLLHFTDQDDVADPLLGVFGSYGGPTMTMPLLLGSPALNSGNNTFCAPVDQRSAPRNDGACDVGAYEYGALPPDLVFMDGFESGTVSRWSASVP